jgi:hypothetical protein
LENGTADLDDAHSSLSALHRITVSFEELDNRLWLVCTDTGVGLTRRIIERYLLVSGSKPRPELLELGRRCTVRGLEFIRTGEFGIGVLSYFMLADKLLLETRASVEAYADAETHGWRFESEGLDAFGELRSLPLRKRGTTIKLRIKPEYSNLDFQDSIVEYIASIVSKAPCTLEVRSRTEAKLQPAGWVRKLTSFSDQCLHDIDWASGRGNPKMEIKSNSQAQTESETRVWWGSLKEKAKEQIRYFGPIEGKLPEGRGCYRLHIPYFDLDGGPSPIFFDLAKDQIAALPNSYFGVEPTGLEIDSWRSFLSLRSDHLRNQRSFSANKVVVAEVDHIKAGTISLSRAHFEVEHQATLGRFLSRVIMDARSQLFIMLASSTFSPLFQDSAELSALNDTKLPSFWGFAEYSSEDGERPRQFQWRSIRFPAVLIPETIEQYTPLRGQEACNSAGFFDELRPLELRFSGLRWPLPGVQPSRIVLDGFTSFGEPHLVYDNDQNRCVGPLAAQFPNEWADVLAITLNQLTVYNRDNLIYRHITQKAWEDYSKLKAELNEQQLTTSASQGDPGRASCFLLAHVAETTEFWEALRDNFYEELQRIFMLVGLAGSTEHFKVWKPGYKGGVRTVSIKGSQFSEGRLHSNSASSLLPFPADRKWQWNVQTKEQKLRTMMKYIRQ